ncbi:MAG: iron-containing redox enzyme family protein [Proteobacteria bacterium]|nr:iron-containing redox enzyme family protein [Pseudomonadota bacterium]
MPMTTLRSLKVPAPEEAFFRSLRGRDDPALARWARQYHFFSGSQARLLGLVVGALDMQDHASLVEVTRALFEEYGSGQRDAVHSQLFARFCAALQLDPAQLPLAPCDVLPGVLGYVQAIDAGYRSTRPGVMLATYCFLERSAVLSYPLMLERLQALGFSPEDLTFFSTHVVQEAAHEQGAFQMAHRLLRTTQEAHGFKQQVERMQEAWMCFWAHFGSAAAQVRAA